MDWKTCLYFSLNFVKPNTRTHFSGNSDPRHLVSSFVSTLEGLATQSKAQMTLRFIEVETAIKIKLSSILQQLKQRHSQRERAIEYDND